MLDPVTQRRAHAPNLPVQSLGQNHAKRFFTDARHFARFGDFTHDLDAVGHHLEGQVRDRPLDRHQVFLLVIVFRAQDFVDDVAVVRQ